MTYEYHVAKRLCASGTISIDAPTYTVGLLRLEEELQASKIQTVDPRIDWHDPEYEDNSFELDEGDTPDPNDCWVRITLLWEDEDHSRHPIASRNCVISNIGKVREQLYADEWEPQLDARAVYVYEDLDESPEEPE